MGRWGAIVSSLLLACSVSPVERAAQPEVAPAAPEPEGALKMVFTQRRSELVG